jgi:hypothetical protein
MPAEPVVSAGLALRVHVRQAGGNGPTRGLNFPLATVALDLASSQPGNGPRLATGEDVLLRLGLWLADVAAEAELAATAPGVAARHRGTADESPIAEPAL